jgi:hypothetical protein
LIVILGSKPLCDADSDAGMAPRFDDTPSKACDMSDNPVDVRGTAAWLVFPVIRRATAKRV